MALGKTVRQLLAETSSAELCEWAAYYRIEPFGELIADQRHGIATSVLANVNRDGKRKPDAYKATDFIYWHDANRSAPEDQPIDPEKQSKLLKAKFAGLRG